MENMDTDVRVSRVKIKFQIGWLAYKLGLHQLGELK